MPRPPAVRSPGLTTRSSRPSLFTTAITTTDSPAVVADSVALSPVCERVPGSPPGGDRSVQSEFSSWYELETCGGLAPSVIRLLGASTSKQQLVSQPEFNSGAFVSLAWVGSCSLARWRRRVIPACASTHNNVSHKSGELRVRVGPGRQGMQGGRSAELQKVYTREHLMEKLSDGATRVRSPIAYSKLWGTGLSPSSGERNRSEEAG